MRILFVAGLHHPAELARAREATPPGAPPPLFPLSMGQGHWERALRGRGHELFAFYRNLPGFGAADVGRLSAERYTSRLTLGKVLRGLANRLPPHYNPDKRARNARLLATAKALQPDVLWLVGDNTVIYADTLAAIKRETGCLVVYASGTSPIVFSHRIEREAARLYDLVLVNDYYHGVQWLELGAGQAVALPLSAITPGFHRRYDLPDDERAALQCDVAFVGTLLPGNLYSRRVRALEALRDFDLGIWSVHEVPPSLRPYLRGRALGERTMQVMSAAKITVNIHGDFMHYGGNMRTFEAAGVGVCQIADDLPGTRAWFTPGEHLFTYTTDHELCETVTRVLADTPLREHVAGAGQAHALAHHTYDHRAAAFEQLLAEVSAHAG